MRPYRFLDLEAHVGSHRTALGSSRVLLVFFGPCWHYLRRFGIILTCRLGRHLESLWGRLALVWLCISMQQYRTLGQEAHVGSVGVVSCLRGFVWRRSHCLGCLIVWVVASSLTELFVCLHCQDCVVVWIVWVALISLIA